MAKIRAFKALRPNKGWASEFDINNEQQGLAFEDLIKVLELHGNEQITAEQIAECRYTLDQLLDKGTLYEEDEALYIYEVEQNGRKYRGLWTLTAVSDLLDGYIIGHEQTLKEQQEKMTHYRQTIGLEGSPVLLTYPSDRYIDELLQVAVSYATEDCYYLEGKRYRTWKITEGESIGKLIRAFEGLRNSYVADGHHRLAASANSINSRSLWIMALYVSSEQISIREFNRVIIPFESIAADRLLQGLQTYFFVSEIPNNVPYRPDKKGRIGMYFNGKWYQLVLRTDRQLEGCDAAILQEYVLAPLFGIKDPNFDPRLHSLPADEWEGLLSTLDEKKEAVGFSLFPIQMQDLVELGYSRSTLPPKSTYIEPKIPYGLILTDHFKYSRIEVT